LSQGKLRSGGFAGDSSRRPHGGHRPWAFNSDDACVSQGTCLKRLPEGREGEAALWNAFRGPWGLRRCVFFGSICDIGTAPNAPSFQGRYDRPWKALDTGREGTLDGERVLVGKYPD
jgi:hypothetical protein